MEFQENTLSYWPDHFYLVAKQCLSLDSKEAAKFSFFARLRTGNDGRMKV